MTASSPNAAPSAEPEPEVAAADSEAPTPAFDQLAWSEARFDDEPASPGGQRVLGAGLVVLAIGWTGYIAWAAGRALASEPLSSPQIAQWVALATAPLALLGLAWLVFGRTRRKEAERFTRSVVAMRTEARSLEALLDVLSRRISDSRSELVRMTQHLMQLGDEATGKLGGITRDLDSSAEKLRGHGDALDRAAELARTDIAVLLDDLPRAEQHARAISEQLRGTASDTAERTAEFDRRLIELTSSAREADEMVAGAAQRLVTHLTHIESASAAAAARVGEAETSFAATIDTLLDRASASLEEIRGGIDVQSAAVTALVEQASAGIGRSGVEAAQTLGANVDSVSTALDTLSARVAEQERASQRMLADIDRSLGELDQRFAELAQSGDERAARFIETLARSRAELEAMGRESDAQHESVGSLGERAEALRAGVERLSAIIGGQLTEALSQAGEDTESLARSTRSIRPEIDWIRDAATEASERLAGTGAAIATQQDGLAALLGGIDEGVDNAQQRLAALTAAIGEAQGEASAFRAETAPALVEAMVQIKEAAAHAAQRAREAIAAIVPQSADELSKATADAFDKVIRESVEERLREVEAVAAKAVDSARAAADRLTGQMLAIGQSAVALEEHLEKQKEARREEDGEAFARRVALLIDSMHSASIDVGKILSDEVDDKAWGSYLKGDRGVFTRRAARLIGSSESKAIRAHYESDGEFHQSTNRFVHDFEAMLRRVLAERDGGTMAVTLMSSDIGKLYAALADAIDRRR